MPDETDAREESGSLNDFLDLDWASKTATIWTGQAGQREAGQTGERAERAGTPPGTPGRAGATTGRRRPKAGRAGPRRSGRRAVLIEKKVT